MISYPFISSLFTNILLKSRAIEGRFYVCPKMGYEINSDVLGQVLTDLVLTNTGKKYPLVLMMPPRMSGNYRAKKYEFVSYNITMFFLKTTYYGTGSAINPNTNTSTHSIQDDWTDMQRCAVSFFSVVNSLQAFTNYSQFRLGSREIPIQPISEIGIDRASGVRCDFEFLLPYGCEPLEDYDESDIELITVPVGDGHPEHIM
jgi:hypothetical protein